MARIPGSSPAGAAMLALALVLTACEGPVGGSGAGGSGGFALPGGSGGEVAAHGGSGGDPGGAGGGGAGGLAPGGSGGSGGDPGPAGIPCDQPFDDATYGLHGCQVDVGGITFKYFPLPEGRRVKRLAVYLHGDTAGEWFMDWIFPEVITWATPRDIMVIAPLSPVGYSEGDHSYGAAQAAQAESVGAAIEQFIAAYRTRSDDLLFWSTSGGSWFITSSFLPLIGGRIQGRFALSCGGSTWWNDWSWDIVPALPRNKIHVLFNYGSEDFLVPGEEASYDRLQTAGFDVSRIVYDGSEHCRHPVNPPSIDYWVPKLP